jgi:hypothetical protein
MTRAADNTKADGLRPVLPDLCHHTEYRIYVNGQYIESAGNLGSNAQHVLDFWQRRRRGKAVEARASRCSVPNCDRRQR